MILKELLGIMRGVRSEKLEVYTGKWDEPELVGDDELYKYYNSEISEISLFNNNKPCIAVMCWTNENRAKNREEIKKEKIINFLVNLQEETKKLLEEIE